jgi:hypothetical protein
MMVDSRTEEVDSKKEDATHTTLESSWSNGNEREVDARTEEVDSHTEEVDSKKEDATHTTLEASGSNGNEQMMVETRIHAQRRWIHTPRRWIQRKRMQRTGH